MEKIADIYRLDNGEESSHKNTHLGFRSVRGYQFVTHDSDGNTLKYEEKKKPMHYFQHCLTQYHHHGVLVIPIFISLLSNKESLIKCIAHFMDPVFVRNTKH